MAKTARQSVQEARSAIFSTVEAMLDGRVSREPPYAALAAALDELEAAVRAAVPVLGRGKR